MHPSIPALERNRYSVEFSRYLEKRYPGEAIAIEADRFGEGIRIIVLDGDVAYKRRLSDKELWLGDAAELVATTVESLVRLKRANGLVLGVAGKPRLFGRRPVPRAAGRYRNRGRRAR